MPAPDHDLAAKARNIARAADRATLATAMADGGWPYASLSMVACDHAARPLLFISDLAVHTQNLAADARASLLFDDTAGLDNPLTGTRVAVLGRLDRCDDDGAKARYLARHPDAVEYAGFSDFGLYRMAVERIHVVAGFGVIHWIGGGDYLYDTTGAEALAGSEADILAHMNGDHAEAVALFATSLLGRGGGEWRMTGIDPEGCDLRLGGEVARVPFDAPVNDAGAARTALVGLTEQARRSEGPGET